MAVDFEFRKAAVQTLTTQIGVYVLCDLDNIPMYVGQSSQGIRQRVQRHLTSARSDIIANRQIDVWEIAYVWEYPAESKPEMQLLERILFHEFHVTMRLMNGAVPAPPPVGAIVPTPAKIVQVMNPKEITEKKHIELRLPRQAEHYAQVVGHFLAVKNSNQVAGAMDAHFERLSRYHALMLGLGAAEEPE